MSTRLENALFARLLVLELAVEVVWSNQLSLYDSNASAAFKVEFVQAMRQPDGGPLTADLDRARRILELIELVAGYSQNFVDKVDAREQRLRAARDSRDFASDG